MYQEQYQPHTEAKKHPNTTTTSLTRVGAGVGMGAAVGETVTGVKSPANGSTVCTGRLPTNTDSSKFTSPGSSPYVKLSPTPSYEHTGGWG